MVLLANEWDRSSHAYKLYVSVWSTKKISQVQVSVSSVNGDGGHSFHSIFGGSCFITVFVFKNSNLFPFHIAAHVSSTITSQKLWKGPLFITKLSLILGRWRIVTKLLNKYPFLKLQNIEPLLTHILAKKNKPSINHKNY